MNPSALRFEILAGLPPYGSPAVPFSSSGDGTHREGFVVRFVPSDGDAWVGNFQPGLSSFSTVEPHPDGRRLVVISGGAGCIVDPADRNNAEFIGGWYDGVFRARDLLILSTPIDFEAIGPRGYVWKTRRISWDGMRNILIHPEDLSLTGEAWSPVEDGWLSFEVDLKSGSVKGGCDVP